MLENNTKILTEEHFVTLKQNELSSSVKQFLKKTWISFLKFAEKSKIFFL